MICTRETLKLKYGLYILLVSYVLFYILYFNFDCKESIYVLKFLSSIYILLEIIIKLSQNLQNYVPSHNSSLVSTTIGIGADHQEIKRKLGSCCENHSLTEFSSNSKSRSKCKAKIFSAISIFFQSVVCVFVIHVIVILFGGYMVQQFDETFTFSLLIATLIFIRPLIIFGSSALLTICEDWNWSNPSQVQGSFVLFGAWLGAFTIPLDWDRPWQVWPLPCAIGGLLGEITSSSLLLLDGITKPKKLV